MNYRRAYDIIRAIVTGDVGLRKVANDDTFNRAKGAVTVTAVFADGREETVVSDPNLVVTMGRRVMSRLIAGAAGGPTILTQTTPFMRVARGNNGVNNASGTPTEAWFRVFIVPGTATFRFEAWAQAGVNPAFLEFSTEFSSGGFTVAQLAAALGATSNWFVSVINGAADASSLVQGLSTHRQFCLAPLANPGDLAASPHARTLHGILTSTTTPSVANLYVSRVRFGTEGHDPIDTTKALDVSSSEEVMRCGLRATEYGETSPGNDYLVATASYPNPQHVRFTATMTAAMANGRSLSEVGLYTTGGQLVAKKHFGQITKSDLFSLRVDWTLIF